MSGFQELRNSKFNICKISHMSDFSMGTFQRSRTSCVEDVVVWDVQAFTSSGAHVSRTSEIKVVWDPNAVKLVKSQYFEVHHVAISNRFLNCERPRSRQAFRTGIVQQLAVSAF